MPSFNDAFNANKYALNRVYLLSGDRGSNSSLYSFFRTDRKSVV